MSARSDSTSCRAQSRSNPDREKNTRVILEEGEGRGAKGIQEGKEGRKERRAERRGQHADGEGSRGEGGDGNGYEAQ